MTKHADYTMFESAERYADFIKMLSENFQCEPTEYYRAELQTFLEEILLMQSRIQILTELISRCIEKDAAFLTEMGILTEDIAFERARVVEFSSYVAPFSEQDLEIYDKFTEKDALAALLNKGLNELLSINDSKSFIKAFIPFQAGYVYLYKIEDALQDHFGEKITKAFFLNPSRLDEYNKVRQKFYKEAMEAIDNNFIMNFHR